MSNLIDEGMARYDKQAAYKTYSPQIFVGDVLYGLGVSMDPKGHSFAGGFERFKEKLHKHLG